MTWSHSDLPLCAVQAPGIKKIKACVFIIHGHTKSIDIGSVFRVKLTVFTLFMSC